MEKPTPPSLRFANCQPSLARACNLLVRSAVSAKTGGIGPESVSSAPCTHNIRAAALLDKSLISSSFGREDQVRVSQPFLFFLFYPDDCFAAAKHGIVLASSLLHDWPTNDLIPPGDSQLTETLENTPRGRGVVTRGISFGRRIVKRMCNVFMTCDSIPGCRMRSSLRQWFLACIKKKKKRGEKRR